MLDREPREFFAVDQNQPQMRKLDGASGVLSEPKNLSYPTPFA